MNERREGLNLHHDLDPRSWSEGSEGSESILHRTEHENF